MCPVRGQGASEQRAGAEERERGKRAERSELKYLTGMRNPHDINAYETRTWPEDVARRRPVPPPRAVDTVEVLFYGRGYR
jgi:hypothetical protein